MSHLINKKTDSDLYYRFFKIKYIENLILSQTCFAVSGYRR